MRKTVRPFIVFFFALGLLSTILMQAQNAPATPLPAFKTCDDIALWPSRTAADDLYMSLPAPDQVVLDVAANFAQAKAHLSTASQNLIESRANQYDFNRLVTQLSGGLMSNVVAGAAKPAENELLAGMLEARDREDWARMIQLFEYAKSDERQGTHERLQYAFARNRLHGAKVRAENTEFVRSIIADLRRAGDRSAVAEAFGILARMYKDEYSETRDISSLKQSIREYLTGFRTDPLNYYPGSAALDVINMLINNHAADIGPTETERYKELQEAVIHELDRTFDQLTRLPNYEWDYWSVTTRMKTLMAKGRFEEMETFAPILFDLPNSAMKLDVTIQNWSSWRDGLVAQDPNSPGGPILDRMLSTMTRRLAELRNGPKLQPSYEARIRFPDTKGAMHTAPITVFRESTATEVDLEIARIQLKARESKVMSIHNWLAADNRRSTDAQPRVLLGVTGPYRKSIELIAKQGGHIPWWEAYQKFGIKEDPAYTDEFMAELVNRKAEVSFFIPKNFRSVHSDSFTWAEFQWLLNRPEAEDLNLNLVLGAYDLLGLQFYRNHFVDQNQADAHAQFLLQRFRDLLLQPTTRINW